MRPQTLLLAYLLGLAAAPAGAQQLGNFEPTRDVTGSYLMTSSNGTKTVTMEYSAGQRVGRVDTGDSQGYILYDFGTQSATSVIPSMHEYMAMPHIDASQMAAESQLLQANNANTPSGPPPKIDIASAGSKTVAGASCSATKYTDESNGDWTILCLGPSNVLLEMDSSNGQTLVAQSISYASVPSADVQIPAGYGAFAMPALPGGMALPNGMSIPGMSPPGQ